MNEKILRALKSPDADMRRKAIQAAAKSHDSDYLRPLFDLYKQETDTEIKELAMKAARYIQSKADVATSTEAKTNDSKHDAKSKEAAKVRAEAMLKSKSKKQRSGSSPIFLFLSMLLVILIVGGVGLALLLSSQVNNGTEAQIAQSRRVLAEAAPLPDGPANETLNGDVYKLRISDEAAFYIQEPVGTQPVDGWRLIVGILWLQDPTRGAPAIHAGFAERAMQDNTIVVAGEFISPDGRHSVSTSAQEVSLMMGRLLDRYDLHARARVFYGWNTSSAVVFYYTRQPGFFNDSFDTSGDFGGASVHNFRSWLQFGDSDSFSNEWDVPTARYLLTMGANDNPEYLRTAQNFVNKMADEGNPVWRYEILPGVTTQRTETTFDLTWQLLESLQ